MVSLEKRIAAMEAQCAATKYRLTPEQDAAGKRISDALKNALAEERVLDQSSGCETDTAAPAEVHRQRDFCPECALRDRMVTDTLTEGDRRVLDALPQDDLALLGTTAEELIKALAAFDDEFGHC